MALPDFAGASRVEEEKKKVHRVGLLGTGSLNQQQEKQSGRNLEAEKRGMRSRQDTPAPPLFLAVFCFGPQFSRQLRTLKSFCNLATLNLGAASSGPSLETQLHSFHAPCLENSDL